MRVREHYESFRTFFLRTGKTLYLRTGKNSFLQAEKINRDATIPDPFELCTE